MKRREFITLLSGAAAWPLAARAQQSGRIRRIGVLLDQAANDPEGERRVTAFQQTLQHLGWMDGRNVLVDIRWAGDSLDRIRVNAAELVGSTPDLIVVAGNFMLSELQRQTKTIPIVFITVSGAVESGFVASLARPGANITGFQNFEPAIAGKLVGLIKEAVPNVSRVAMLLNPDTAVHVALLHAAEALAPSLGVQVAAVGVRDSTQIERGIADFANNAYAREDILRHAYALARANSGAPGRDGNLCADRGVGLGEVAGGPARGTSFEDVPARSGAAGVKPDGGERPLGIPTIRDRVVWRSRYGRMDVSDARKLKALRGRKPPAWADVVRPRVLMLRVAS